MIFEMINGNIPTFLNAETRIAELEHENEKLNVQLTTVKTQLEGVRNLLNARDRQIVQYQKEIDELKNRPMTNNSDDILKYKKAILWLIDNMEIPRTEA